MRKASLDVLGMMIPYRIAVSAVVVSSALQFAASSGVHQPGGSTVPPHDVLARAISAMGGLSALQALPPLATEFTAAERSLGQQSRADEPAPSSVQIGTRVLDASGRREALSMRRHMSGGRVYERTVHAPRWAAAAPRPVSGVRSADLEQALASALATLSPEALLPALYALSGACTGAAADGARSAVLRCRLDGRDLHLHFGADDRLLRRVRFHDPVLGGTDAREVAVTFTQYRPANALRERVRLPHQVDVTRGNEPWLSRSYAEFRYADSTQRMGVQAGVGSTASDSVQVVPIGVGVSQARGGDNSALLVELEASVAVVELPDTPERTERLLAVARGAGRPVDVVLTHPHEDHAIGLGAPGMRGVRRVYAPASGADGVRRALRRIHGKGAPVVVPLSGSMRLGSGERRLELLTVPHSHFDGILVAFVPHARLLFEADLIRGLLPHSTDELVTWVDGQQLPVDHVASSHGTVLPWAQVRRASARWRDSLRQPPAVARVTRLSDPQDDYPTISPDGQRIAFQSNRSGTWQLWLMNRDGSGLRRLTRSDANDRTPDWSPDGRALVFSSDRAGADGSGVTPGRRNIFRIEVDGDPERAESRIRRVVAFEGQDIHPKWGAGGSAIVFNRVAPTGERDGAELMRVRADGTELQRIDVPPGVNTYASLTPDGQRIVYRGTTRETIDGREVDNSDIMSAGSDGTSRRRLTVDPAFDGWPSISPNGRTIAFASRRVGSRYQIFFMPIDGGTARQITFGDFNHTQPAWAPDGRSLVAYRWSADAIGEIGQLVSIALPAASPGASPHESSERS